MARFCLQAGCSEIVEGTRVAYCTGHTVHQNWKGSKSTARGWAWTSLRKKVLKRDGYRCVKCKRPASEVDHIINVASGGTDDMTNLQSLCTECHQVKSLREAYEGRGRRGSA